MIKKILGSVGGQILVVLLGLAIISACSMSRDASAEKQQTLENTQWTLKSMGDIPLPTESQAIPTLSFESDRITGFSGCNRMFGNYVASTDGTLAFGQLGMTKMACAAPADQIEREVTARLSQTSIYALTHSQLSLLDANRKTLLVYTLTKP